MVLFWLLVSCIARYYFCCIIYIAQMGLSVKACIVWKQK